MTTKMTRETYLSVDRLVEDRIRGLFAESVRGFKPGRLVQDSAPATVLYAQRMYPWLGDGFQQSDIAMLHEDWRRRLTFSFSGGEKI